MRRYEVEVTGTTTADPATVYRLLRDGSTWPDWSPIDALEVEREGEGEREGVGAVRVLRNGRVTGRDEITGFEENRRFSYRHLGGLPVRDYHGEIELTPTDGGTAVRWHVSFSAKMPGSGFLVHPAIRRFIGQCVRSLVAYCDATDRT